MLEDAALGLFVREYSGQEGFEHGGANAGFRCRMLASVRGGEGIVVRVSPPGKGPALVELRSLVYDINRTDDREAALRRVTRENVTQRDQGKCGAD